MTYRIKTVTASLAVALFAATGSPWANAQAKKKAPATTQPTQIVIVVAKENPVDSVNKRDLKRIFLRQKTKWPNGSNITVYERHTKNPIRKEFSQRVLGKKPNELKEYWLNLKLTRAMKAPKVCRSDKLLRRYLERVKGGIGYMYLHEIDDKVKVVYKVEVGDRARKAN